jgi:uncharacterized protein YkwD
MRTTRRLLQPAIRRTAVLACAAVAVGVLAPGALARPSAQSLRLAGLVNEARGGAGVTDVGYDRDLSSLAHHHSEAMAEDGRLSHTPDLEDSVPPGWHVLAENIGVGSSVEEIFQAFMESGEHRAHIEGADFHDVGVGVVLDGDTYWVTMVFRG